MSKLLNEIKVIKFELKRGVTKKWFVVGWKIFVKNQQFSLYRCNCVSNIVKSPLCRKKIEMKFKVIHSKNFVLIYYLLLTIVDYTV